MNIILPISLRPPQKLLIPFAKGSPQVRQSFAGIHGLSNTKSDEEGQEEELRLQAIAKQGKLAQYTEGKSTPEVIEEEQ